MQTTIHVRVREGHHELGLDARRACIDLKNLALLPFSLDLLFNINKRVTLKSLKRIQKISKQKIYTALGSLMEHDMTQSAYPLSLVSSDYELCKMRTCK